MKANSELSGMRKYLIAELKAVSVDDRHAVRDEAMRRHAIAANKLAKLNKEVSDLETLIKEVI